jgi:hypothetical protein
VQGVAEVPCLGAHPQQHVVSALICKLARQQLHKAQRLLDSLEGARGAQEAVVPQPAAGQRMGGDSGKVSVVGGLADGKASAELSSNSQPAEYTALIPVPNAQQQASPPSDTRQRRQQGLAGWQAGSGGSGGQPPTWR